VAAVSAPTVSETLVGAIARALQGLRFGSVEITVHDGRVTLIERREKVRMNDHEETAPIGPPKDALPRHPPTLEEDPTGRPEAPLTEHDDATRNMDRLARSDGDPDAGDGGGRNGDGVRRRSGSPGAGTAGAAPCAGRAGAPALPGGRDRA
jgi:hypothetical protein